MSHDRRPWPHVTSGSVSSATCLKASLNVRWNRRVLELGQNVMYGNGTRRVQTRAQGHRRLVAGPERECGGLEAGPALTSNTQSVSLSYYFFFKKNLFTYF